MIRMEKVLCLARGKRRPRGGGSPDIARGAAIRDIADDVIGHSRFFTNGIGRSLKPAGEPVPRIDRFPGRLITVREPQIARLVLKDAVRPWTHDEFLISARLRTTLMLIAVKGIDGALRENIPITADVNGGSIRPAVITREVALLPVGIVEGMRNPNSEGVRGEFCAAEPILDQGFAKDAIHVNDVVEIRSS